MLGSKPYTVTTENYTISNGRRSVSSIVTSRVTGSFQEHDGTEIQPRKEGNVTTRQAVFISNQSIDIESQTGSAFKESFVLNGGLKWKIVGKSMWQLINHYEYRLETT